MSLKIEINMIDVPKFIVDNSFLFCCEDRKGGHIYRKNYL